MAGGVGLYLRLSRDDGAEGESMSIANQRELLTRYAGERGWAVEREYADDGCTGTNFRRPGFRRLLGDIESGRIGTVLTKDLSRLGRDQIGTLYYLQVYFPAHRVRYIAVGEGIDTGESWGQGAMAPFLAAANDYYAADISRKVRAALDTRKAQGLFIGAGAPLGYRKDPEHKGRLLVDEETAWVVERVFETYLGLASVRGTARALTEAGVPTPAAEKGGQKTSGAWSDTMVRRVLKNPTYAGHLTQNRRRKLGYKVERYETLPEEEWITVRDTHPPLVSQEVFDRAQALLKVRSYTPPAGREHLFTGVCFCADCGSAMGYVRDGGREYLVCRGHRREGGCSPHRVREDRVEKTLRRELERLCPGERLGALDRRRVVELVEWVRVREDRSLTIRFRFREPSKKMEK